MHKITLTDGREFKVDTNSTPLNTEMMLIEKVTGWDSKEYERKLASGSMTAVTAYVFVLIKREAPDIRFDDIVFSVDDMVDLDPPVADEEENVDLPKDELARASDSQPVSD